jgi:hypothetical protein
VRTAVLGGNEIDTRTAFLLSLASACSVVGRLFSRDERRIAKKRIKAIIENELIGKAVNDAVTAAVLNAATAAAVAAAVAASTSSSG